MICRYDLPKPRIGSSATIGPTLIHGNAETAMIWAISGHLLLTSPSFTMREGTALRALVGALDLRGDDGWVTGPDDPVGLQPDQDGAHRPLGQIGVADQGPDARECL